MSFKWKTSLTITIIIAVILLLTNFFVFVSFSQMAIGYQEDLLVVRIDQLIDDIRKNPKLTLETWQSELDRNQYIRILNGNNRPVLEKGANFPREWIPPELLKPDANEQLELGKFDYRLGKEHIIYARKTIKGQMFGQQMLTFELYENANEVDRLVSFIRNLLLIGSLGGIALAAGASYWTARATIRPIGTIAGQVKRMDMETLHERIPLPPSKDELHGMAVTFNALLERLESGFEQQKQFIADASHELRTPLSIIEGHANLLKRWGMHKPEVLEESLGYMLNETERLRLLTDQLLQTATLDSMTGELAEAYEPSRLHAAVQEACSQGRFLNGHVQLACSLPEEDPLIAVPALQLRQALLNIVSNAMKYTPAGGQVSVSAELADGFVRIAVEDTGIGIQESELPRLFERFYRSDKSRGRNKGGSGLGLPITKKIIDLYRGTIDIKSSYGKGTTVTILLPLAEAESPSVS